MFGSGNSEESALFAARHRFGLAMSFMPVSRVQRMVALYKAEAMNCGWSPVPEQVLYRGICAMDAPGEDNAFDRAEAEAFAKGTDAPLIVRGAFFTGGAKGVLHQIAKLREAGVGVIDMDIVSAGDSIDYTEQAALLERFARDVLPEIRSY
jgi:alkanesulfonate monooxygenase SsuD/methylene tetrahydromethanopterin reductase-like flavin-dependent oxidoreductase (luciferase family)